MKVCCDRVELAERLLSVSGIVSSAPTTKPILQDFHLKAKGNEFLAEVTDLDISARIQLERVEVQEDGELALQANRLIGLAREIPASRLTLETFQGSIKGGEAESREAPAEDTGWESSPGSGALLKAEGYVFHLLGDDPAEFPEVLPFAAETALSVQRQGFVEMLRRVCVAASRDTSRFQLTGVFFEIEKDKVRMTATDGKRLTNDYMRIENKSETVVSGIVPNRAVDVILRVLGDGEENIRLALLETELQLEFSHGQVMAKLIEGRFPDYQAAIPSDPKTRVTGRKADLVTAVRSASLVTDRETATIVFNFAEDHLSLESHASDIGESRIEVPISLQGEPVTIRFNPIYFLDALRATHEEEVRLELSGSERPASIRGGQHYRHLLMPLVTKTSTA